MSTLLATTILTASSTVEYMSTSFIQMSSMLSNVSRRVTSYAAHDPNYCQVLSGSNHDGSLKGHLDTSQRPFLKVQGMRCFYKMGLYF